MTAQSQIRLDVWSDYVCPFCYLELPMIERLQAELGDALSVGWRAFELRPEPVPTLDPGGEYLRSAWARVVYPMAAQRGMALTLPPLQPRSRTALEAAALQEALEEGRHREAVLEDKHLAQELHITAVPAMLLRRAGADWRSALPLSGALPYEQVRDAALDLLRRAQ